MRPTCFTQRAALFGAVSLAALVSGLPALADDDCGVIGMGGTATCNAANEADSYQNGNGITYLVTDLTINHSGDGVAPTEFITSGAGLASYGALSVTNTGTIVQTDAVSGQAGSNLAKAGIFASSYNGAVTIVNALGASITTNSKGRAGMAALQTYAGASLTNNGTIITTGKSSHGIYASVYAGTGDLTIANSGTIDVRQSGHGISASNLAGGDVFVTVSGTVTTAGGSGVFATTSGFGGLTGLGQSKAHAGPDVDVRLIAATVNVTGSGFDAGVNIFDPNKADAHAYVLIDATSTINASLAGGVRIQSGPLIEVQHNGRILGDATAAVGIYAGGYQGGVYVTQSGSTSMQAAYAHGIHTGTRNGHTQSITLTTTGRITTAGDYAHGIFAERDGNSFISVSGQIATTGARADAVHSQVSDCHTISVEGRAVASGDGSAGIYLARENDGGGGLAPLTSPSAGLAPVPGCAALHTGDVFVSGTVLGGYDAAAPGTRAAGISIVDTSLLNLATPVLVDIENEGDIGALSDVAVLTNLNGFRVGVDLVNSGNLVGELRFISGTENNSVTNSGVWAIRGYADTDGDGLRDQERIALNLFEGDNDIVTNEAAGVISLLSSDGTDVGAAGVEETELRGLETLINNGLITMADAQTGFGAAVAGDRFLLQGNLFGNGSIALDALLNEGGAGNQTTDRFLVQGDVDGSMQVFVTNTTGLGGITGTAANEGISIIQVTGQASANSFVLGQQVVGGAYLYELNAFAPDQSDLSELDGRLTGQSFWDFRLQSTGELFNGVYEYPKILNAAGQLFWSDLDVLHRRLGEIRPNLSTPLRYQLRNEGGQSAALGATDTQEAVKVGRLTGQPEAAWLKGFGSGLDYDIGLEQSVYGLVGGYDKAEYDAFQDGDLLIYGPLAGFASSDVDFHDSDSELDLAVVRAGGYLVYLDNAFYVDAVGKVDYAWGTFVAPLSLTDDDVTLTTAGLSIESGYTLMVSERAYLEPQGQLSYSHTWGSDLQDGSGATITLDGYDSLVGRLGMRVGANYDVGGRGRASPYIEAGVLHEFLGGSSAEVSGLSIDADISGTTYEIGGGIHAAQLSSHVQAYVDLLYRFGEMEGVKGVMGVRVSW